MGHLNASRLTRIGAGKCPFFITEELALQQGAGNGGAIDIDKGAAGDARPGMDVTCHNTLARAAVVLNKKRNTRAREFLDLLAEVLHSCRTAKDHFLWWQTVRA